MGLSTAERGLDLPSERERLMAAMARCCARDGYMATTVEEVVAEAGVSGGDFDEQFASKEECAIAAVEVILGETMTTFFAAYSADTSEWESALRALRAMLELFAARPAFAGLAFIASRQMMPAAALERYESGFAVLSAILNRLRAYSEDDGGDSPAAAARAAIGGGEALIRREISAGRAERLPQLLPELAYTATVAFLGQEEALRLARQARELLKEPR